MQDDHSPERERTEGKARIRPDDMATELEMLELVLGEHPVQLTVAEIGLALDDFEDFASRDAIDRALWELIRRNLLRRCGDSVLPPLPAIYFDRLRRHDDVR